MMREGKEGTKENALRRLHTQQDNGDYSQDREFCLQWETSF